MARRRRPALIPEDAPLAAPILYTAQEVARFCEVDLKTIHHWADGAKILHHRTAGRHLRFRRNHVLAFLRSHGYPIPDAVTTARPSILYAVPPRSPDDRGPDDTAKKLLARFAVHRFDAALHALAHLVAFGPDAIVVRESDPTWSGELAVRTLKAHADTAWPVLIVIASDPAAAATLEAAGADLVLPELLRLPAELSRLLAVD
jgi:excisionase family DNA binding protein